MDDSARPPSPDPRSSTASEVRSPIPEGPVAFGDFVLDWPSEILIGPEGEVRLRRQTLLLLKALLRAHPRVLSRDDLLDEVWGVDHVSPSSVKQTISELRAALSDSASDPRYIQTLHRQGYRFIAPVRPIAPVSPTPHPSPAASEPSPLGEPPTRRPKRVVLAVAALLVLAVGLAASWWTRSETESTDAAGVGPVPQRLAILGFRSMSPGHEEWIGSALRELTTVELLTVDQLTVIPVGQSDRVDPRSFGSRLTLAQAHEVSIALAADLIASGSYLVDADDRLSVQWVVQRPDSDVVLAISQTRELSDLAPLARDIAEQLIAKLPQVERPSRDGHDPSRFFSDDPEVIRLYADGQERLRRRELVEARQSFSQALEREPKNPWLREGLSSAWAQLGFQERAIHEAGQAVELSRHLPSSVQLAFRSRLHQARDDWHQAVPLLRRLWTQKTGDLEVGLQLAACERRAGRPGAANEVLLLLEAMNPHAAGDARLARERAAVAESQGDLETAVEALILAESVALARGDRAVLAAIKASQSHLYYKTNDLDSSVAAATDAEAIFREVGDAFAVAQATRLRGKAQQQQGDLDGAEASYLAAERTFEQLGTRRELGKVLNDMAALATARGDLGSVTSLLQESLDLKKEVRDWEGAMVTLGNLALIRLNLDQLQAARRDLKALEALNRDVGNLGFTARGHWYRGKIEFREGDWSRAEASFADAAALFQQTGDALDAIVVACEQLEILIGMGQLDRAARSFESLQPDIDSLEHQVPKDICLDFGGQLALHRGELDVARARFQTILDGNGSDTTYASLVAVEGLLRAARMAGDLDEARQRLEVFQSAVEGVRSEILETTGRVAEIELLLARGDGASAAARNPLGQVGAGADSPRVVELGILLARARLLSGDCRAARVALDAVAELVAIEPYGMQLEWRRVEVLQALRCGRPDVAREWLDSAIRDARRTGFRFLEMQLRGLESELLSGQARETSRARWLQDLEATGLFGARGPEPSGPAVE